jgi:hypothetical protein
MSLSASERQVLIDLIGAVRTLATNVLAVHLQLGAVRTLLDSKGTLTNVELSAAMTELSARAAFDEVTNPDMPSTNEVFDELLRRLEQDL